MTPLSDEIASLKAEIERLTRSRDYWREQWKSADGLRRQLADALEEAFHVANLGDLDGTFTILRLALGGDEQHASMEKE